MKILKISNLHKRYSNTEILKGISLTVSRGEMYALMGPNGSGKTTLTSIIACTNIPTSGKVEILGYDTVKKAERVKKLIGYVPQERFSSPLMTGEENLLYFIRLSGIPKKEAIILTRELLKKMDLEKDARKRVSQYSGGMRKKLEVATALLPDVKFLILDEPTTGLDPSARKKFFSKIKDIQKEGVTIFYVTHIGEDAEIASKVGLIDDGNIIIEGSPNRLRKESGLDHNAISIDTTIKNQNILRTIKTVINDGKLYETRTGYRFYCEESDSVINKVINRLGKIDCSITKIEKTIPSLEDIFFKFTEKRIAG